MLKNMTLPRMHNPICRQPFPAAKWLFTSREEVLCRGYRIISVDMNWNSGCFSYFSYRCLFYWYWFSLYNTIARNNREKCVKTPSL